MPFVLAWRYNRSDDWTLETSPVFEDGSEAATRAKELNERMKRWDDTTRYRVAPITIDDPLAWRLREQEKFNNGTYTRPPWFEDNGETQWLEHVDPDDPTKIRFYLNEKQAQQNKFTRMAPGRFYLRYIDGYPSPGVVERYCAKMGLDETVSKLKIGTTADDFVRVYTEGPHSCMAYRVEDGKFCENSELHPVAVYGDLDLAISYIERAGEITGRAIVWPEKKIHGRIYGDMDRMRERLREEGYEEDWDFSGARLALKRTKYDKIIAPYVDGDLGGRIEGDYLVLTKSPFIVLQSPDGIAETEGCQNCGAEGVPLAWDSDPEQFVCDNCMGNSSECDCEECVAARNGEY